MILIACRHTVVRVAIRALLTTLVRWVMRLLRYTRGVVGAGDVHKALVCQQLRFNDFVSGVVGRGSGVV